MKEIQELQAILEESDSTRLEAALEQWLNALNHEIAMLRSQQRLVALLLQRKGKQTGERPVDVVQWVTMQEEAGVDEAALQGYAGSLVNRHHKALIS